MIAYNSEINFDIFKLFIIIVLQTIYVIVILCQMILLLHDEYEISCIIITQLTYIIIIIYFIIILKL